MPESLSLYQKDNSAFHLRRNDTYSLQQQRMVPEKILSTHVKQCQQKVEDE